MDDQMYGLDEAIKFFEDEAKRNKYCWFLPAQVVEILKQYRGDVL
jgi:hypothetical protein